MDVILHTFDEYLLDRLYAHLVPLVPKAMAAATIIPASLSANGTVVNGTMGPAATPEPSAWSYLLPLLSHGKGAASGPLLSASNFALSSNDAQFVSAWPRDYIPRQLLSMSVLTLLGVHFLYFTFAWASYKWIFNHEMMKHPRFLKNQVKLEIQSSLRGFPVMMLLTLPWFLAEVRGYSMLYDDVADYGWTWLIASVCVFLFLTDLGIYWIHRLEHHPSVYKYVHKPHHKWIIPTPFASHAFHPLDGYLQSIPYHLIVFIFPFHRYLYLGLFVFVNFWTIFIHDSDLITGHPLEKIINGPAHHTLHHLHFNVNYGQYFTWADRTGGSYRQPAPEDDPMHAVDALKANEATKKAQ